MVRLLQDGIVIDEKTVTEADGWSYTFDNLPDIDSETGEPHVYSISEKMVSGYYTLTDGYDIINVLLPSVNPPSGKTDPPRDHDVPHGITEIGEPSEEELEELIDLFDYGIPLWGELLRTGDELPAYPFVFGGIAILAVILLIVINRKKKK